MTGSAHLRHGRPNQDAFAQRRTADGVAAVVADGHGAAQHPRSAAGARLAAEVLADRLADVLRGRGGDAALRTAADSFFRDWRDRVAGDAAARPLDATERAAMGGGDGSADFVRRAYGTTVLGVVAAPRWVGAVAVGDGELGWVDDAGADQPLCAVSRRIGVETESVAAVDPERSLRIQTLAADEVRAVWACTDGFSDAQQDPRWRALVAGQLRALNGGGAGLEDDLRGWLTPAAQTGGDDTTMVLLLRRA